MTTFTAGGITLNYVDERQGAADGLTMIFHHGMGGELSQPLGQLADLRVDRLILPDARGHGASSAMTSVAEASFDLLADDVIRLADHLELDRFVMGGISMGAGASLNLALRYPARVKALILARPAWLDGPMEGWKRELFGAIAALLEAEDIADADRLLTERPDFQRLAAQYPASGTSLRGQLTRQQAKQSTAVLRGFPATAPSSDASAWARIDLPTLVIAHGDDPFHPYETGEELARAIRGARLATIPSKERDEAAFNAGLRTAVQEFLDALA